MSKNSKYAHISGDIQPRELIEIETFIEKFIETDKVVPKDIGKTDSYGNDYVENHIIINDIELTIEGMQSLTKLSEKTNDLFESLVQWLRYESKRGWFISTKEGAKRGVDVWCLKDSEKNVYDKDNYTNFTDTLNDRKSKKKVQRNFSRNNLRL